MKKAEILNTTYIKSILDQLLDNDINGITTDGYTYTISAVSTNNKIRSVFLKFTGEIQKEIAKGVESKFEENEKKELVIVDTLQKEIKRYNFSETYYCNADGGFNYIGTRFNNRTEIK